MDARFILAVNEPRRASLRQRGDSRMRAMSQARPDLSVKLTVIHEIDKPDSKLIGAVSTACRRRRPEPLGMLAARSRRPCGIREAPNCGSALHPAAC
jgi:hypothetical protein